MTSKSRAKKDVLTAQQKAYCEHRALGHTMLDSYRHAYNAENSKNGTCSVNASKLEGQTKIREYLKELGERTAKAVDYTLEQHVLELRALYDQAKAAGNYGAAKDCLVHIGKATGHYTDKVSIQGETLAPAALLSSLETQDPALAAALAQTLGLTPPNDTKH